MYIGRYIDIYRIIHRGEISQRAQSSLTQPPYILYERINHVYTHTFKYTNTIIPFHTPSQTRPPTPSNATDFMYIIIYYIPS